MPSGFINKDLAAIFLDEFVTNYQFGRHAFDYKKKNYKKVNGKRQSDGEAIERCSGDPWWWPVANGETLEQWGLASDDYETDGSTLEKLLTSLRGWRKNLR